MAWPDFSIFANTSDFWLTRFVFLRFLGLVYLVAFISLVRQVIPLLGERGLTPARQHLDGIRYNFRNGGVAMWKLPTLFWFNCSDKALRTLAWLGLGLSFLVMIGYANVIILFALWLIYLSFVHVGQLWYGYGWETELLETGLIAVFMVPLISLSPFPQFATPVAAIWLLLWLAFRVHFGAGMIKMRSDSCWKDLTCLNYHFETQPLPNPLSRYFHFAPKIFLKLGVLWTHFAQLVIPVFLFIPGIPRIVAGITLLVFQIILILSGNLSFINLVSLAAVFAAFNDDFLQAFLPSFIVDRATDAASNASPDPHYAAWAFFALAAILSIPVIKNFFSRRQLMNASFNQFHLMNAYGAFGTVGRKRFELVVKGAYSREDSAEWKEYEFIAKPGNPERKLPVIAPYQPRIDWQIWFAAMQTPSDNPWILNFIWKLLHNDKGTLSLISRNPFPDKPPKYVKVDMYEYRFARPGSKKVWERKPLGEWLKPLSADSLEEFIRDSGWDHRKDSEQHKENLS